MANGDGESKPGRRDSGFQVARRVLVFEGRPATLTPLVKILEEDGYLVETATDWNAMAERLGPFNPHAVLVDLDVSRPVMDGAHPRFMFTEFPFGRLPPIVGFSSRERAPALEVAAWIEKPFLVEDLLRTLAVIVHDETVRRANVAANAASSR